MATICLEPASALAATIGMQAAIASPSRLLVSTTGSGQVASSYHVIPSTESREEILSRARARMRRMSKLASRRRDNAPDYPDDDQSLIEQSAVTSLFMPLQAKAMRDADS